MPLFINLKKSNSLKKNVFLYVFHCFSPFMPKSESLLTLFALPRSLLKSNWSDFLLSLFTKERSWANRSRCSLQKSDCEQFAPVALLLTKNERFTRKTKEQILNPEKKQWRPVARYLLGFLIQARCNYCGCPLPPLCVTDWKVFYPSKAMTTCRPGIYKGF